MKNRSGFFRVFLAIIMLPAVCGLAISAPTDATPLKLYRQGKEAQIQEQYFKAIELYRSALEQAPDFRKPIIGLAESYFALEEYEAALDWVVKAKKYDKNNPELLNLEGRILVALGMLDEARGRFAAVLNVEPHNIAANFGLAELGIVEGKTNFAASKYHEALRYSPHNKQALLSLMLVYDSQGERRKAEEYIRQALNHYSHDPQVHYYAAKHYFRFNELDEAELQANIALSLRENYIDVVLLLSNIYLEQGRYGDVVPLLNTVIAENRENNILWYLLGLAYAQTRKIDQSINSFTRAFRIRTDDEISRIYAEYVAVDNYPMDDPVRKRFAEYHFGKGETYEEKNYFQKALDEYRRGLKIDPFSTRGRLLYGHLLYKLGHPARYLSQLEIVIDDLEYTSTDVTDEYEIQESLREDSVANRWNIRQFPVSLKRSEEENGEKRAIPLERFQYDCMLFFMTREDIGGNEGGGELAHFAAEPILARYLHDLFLHHETLRFSGDPKEYNGFAEAFNQARNAGVHYFLVASFDETARAFLGKCDVYNAKTGDTITSYSAFRTGNNKVADTLDAISTDFIEALPVRGRIVDRRFDAGLINLGKYDGIGPEDTLTVVKKGGVSIAREEIDLVYTEEDILGEITVEKTDELISEGPITTEMFFDLINPGDEVVKKKPKPDEEAEEKPAEGEEQPARISPVSELYREIIQIR